VVFARDLQVLDVLHATRHEATGPRGCRGRIAAVALGPDLQMAACALADLPRLRSGALPDDVGVILRRR
jgi:hypothetical protein